MTPTNPQSDVERKVEELSAKLHDIYQEEAKLQERNGIGKARHYDDYNALAENVKEFDRVLARFILERETRLEKEMEVLRKSRAFSIGSDNTVHLLECENCVHLEKKLELIFKACAEVERMSTTNSLQDLISAIKSAQAYNEAGGE